MTLKKKHTARQPRSVSTGRAEEFRRVRIATLGDLAGVVGHEVHNVLGALRTCVQVLRRNPHLSSQDCELLDIVESGGRRLNEIFSRLSAFRPATHSQEEVRLNELIEETLALLRRDERCASSIVVRHRLDPSVRTIQANRERIGQALWNLLLNAVEAIGNHGYLDVETRKSARGIRISIRDTGPGIPTASLPRIFDPLRTTKPRAAGLGLALARCVVEQYGGNIAVHSRPGGGTAFTVRLPAGRNLDPSKRRVGGRLRDRP